MVSKIGASRPNIHAVHAKSAPAKVKAYLTTASGRYLLTYDDGTLWVRIV